MIALPCSLQCTAVCLCTDCACFVDKTHWFRMNLSKKSGHQDKVLLIYPVRTHQQARFVVKHLYAESTDSAADLRSQTNNNNYATAQTWTWIEFDITYNFVKDKRRNTWLKRLISTLKIMSNGVNLESNGGSVNSDGDNSIGEDGMRRKNSLERYRPGAYFNLVNLRNRCMSIWNEKRKINNSSTM